MAKYGAAKYGAVKYGITSTTVTTETQSAFIPKRNDNIWDVAITIEDRQGLVVSQK